MSNLCHFLKVFKHLNIEYRQTILELQKCAKSTIKTVSSFYSVWLPLFILYEIGAYWCANLVLIFESYNSIYILEIMAIEVKLLNLLNLFKPRQSS